MGLLGTSESLKDRKAILVSDIFEIEQPWKMNSQSTSYMHTRWQIIATPYRNEKGKDYLLFTLISLSSKAPNGWFHFQTLSNGRVWDNFKSIPLDSDPVCYVAIRHYPQDSLVLRVNLGIFDGRMTFMAPRTL